MEPSTVTKPRQPKPRRRQKRRGKRCVARTGSRQSVSVPLIPSPQGTTFADRVTVDLVYVGRHNASSALTNTSYVYNANSCYDPDSSGLGHQPLGFDFWSGIYSRYCVSNSMIRVTAINNLTTSVRVAVIPSSSLTLPTFANTIDETAFCRERILTASNGARNMGVINSSMSTSKMFGNVQVDPASSVFSALTSANPSTDGRFFWYLFVGTFNDTTALTSPGVDFLVKLTYRVTFTNRRTIQEN